MGTKAQHETGYERLSQLRAMREEAGLTHRALGERLGKSQSWVYNCESLNRRVDVAEFADWAAACGVEALVAFERFLAATDSRDRTTEPEPTPGRKRSGKRK